MTLSSPPDRIEAVRAAMRKYPGEPDSPPTLIMGALLDLTEELRASQRDLSGPALLAAFRKAATNVSPLAEREYRWRRWCNAAIAGSACLGVVVMVGLVVWGIPLVRMATQCAEVFDQGGGKVCQVRYWIIPPTIAK